ncbi:hypothetical protein VSX64_07770 [Aurantimonas sp. C2-6-R+9]|uniref:hypothetical protein n=1 Tax=unclassified Aurantimonas TaxID=2638230 RepID=UPI002E18EB31|nr:MULTISPECIES: hypothetical protein [unclassified Aurantimonas]MEC5289339.1 hypothetical protein [Aurantimonas sp. C2-3-R2]MEC5380783.1 hypothetical protein [Aurantimonas sp. C2-6-R+9]MEC5410419.1 hypothetical protein [Aurantimonas sp. C2-4-R8]
MLKQFRNLASTRSEACAVPAQIRTPPWSIFSSCPAPMFRHDSRPYSINWRLDRAHLEHGKEAPLGASFNGGRPGECARSLRVAGQVKDMNHALPNRLTVVSLVNGDRLHVRRPAAVLTFNSTRQLPGVGSLNH